MTDGDDHDAELDGDRKTVAALAAQGDLLTKPRLVDHWIYFETAKARDRFVDEVATLGFTITDTHGEAMPPNRFCAKVSSVTPVDLESIHGVVMSLVGAANRHAGEYDGWESPW
ncbi:MAG: ribonuclease E inhibitor RraB [Kofleriaceae bacterium]|nr:ribonuclease E inhibitor RraB [Kofleriaceae bacterium]